MHRTLGSRSTGESQIRWVGCPAVALILLLSAMKSIANAQELEPRASEFAGHRQKAILGAGLDVVIPIGEYAPDKIINLSANRWAFRTSVGGSRALGGWTLELLADAWLYTENPHSLNGATVKQEPILGLLGHVTHTFARWFWVGLDVGYGSGGRTKVNGVAKDNNQNSSRVGVTAAIILAPRHGLKVSCVSAVSTRIWADLDIVALAYQYRWGGGI